MDSKPNVKMDFGEDDDFELSEPIRYNCIYLVYLSSIGRKGEKIYKFGKTYRSKNRFYLYPINSTIIFLTRVKDCHHVEDEILELFKKRFTQRTGYGREYFEINNVRLMINYMNRIIDKMDQRVDDDMVKILMIILMNQYSEDIDDNSHNSRQDIRAERLEKKMKLQVKQSLKKNDAEVKKFYTKIDGL